MKRAFPFVLAAVATLALAGCSQPADSPSAAGGSAAASTDSERGMTPKPAVGTVKEGVFVNESGVPLCPVDGMAVKDTYGMPSETYNGVKYWFCMKACKLAFDKAPSKYALAKGETSKTVEAQPMGDDTTGK